MTNSVILPINGGVEIPDTDLSVTTAKEVQMICLPLFKYTNINYFHYGRIYPDGRVIVLNCNSKWHKHVFKYALTPTTLRSQPGIYLVNSITPDRARDAKQYFDLDDFIEFIVEHPNYFEVFAFASSLSIGYEFYFSHLDYVERFKLYFREKARNLINQIKKCPIIIPLPQKDHKISNSCPLDINEAFFVKKYYLDDQQKCYFTYREVTCLQLLSKGYSMKRIAGLLKISPRTVETHIENMKLRYGFPTTSKLSDFFMKSDVGKSFMYTDLFPYGKNVVS